MRRLLALYLSPTGALGRKPFWLAYAAQSLLVIAVAFSIAMVEDGAGWRWIVATVVLTLLSLVLGYTGLMLGAKRFRDRGRSGWWVLVGYVPIVGGAWVLAEMARRGKPPSSSPP